MRLALGFALLIGVAVRALSVAGVPEVRLARGIGDREALVQRIQSSAVGDSALRPFRLDPKAHVVLGVGPDGQPGKAGVNDNADAMLDDPGELGAVGSDDVCLSPGDPGYENVAADPQSIVISKGAFVESDNASATRYLVDGFGWFMVE